MNSVAGVSRHGPSGGGAAGHENWGDFCGSSPNSLTTDTRSDGGVIPPIAERKTWVCTVLWLPQRTITDVQRLTGDTAEGEDASVSTFAPTDNLRLRKAPICLVLSGNKPCELECANPQ